MDTAVIKSMIECLKMEAKSQINSHQRVYNSVMNDLGPYCAIRRYETINEFTRTDLRFIGFFNCPKYYEKIQINLNDWNTDDSFTMANSNSFFESLGNSLDSPRKQIFMDILEKFSSFVMK